jgi:hypothetical protein
MAESGLYEIKKLGWNFNLQAISSSGRRREEEDKR